MTLGLYRDHPLCKYFMDIRYFVEVSFESNKVLYRKLTVIFFKKGEWVVRKQWHYNMEWSWSYEFSLVPVVKCPPCCVCTCAPNRAVMSSWSLNYIFSEFSLQLLKLDVLWQTAIITFSLKFFYPQSIIWFTIFKYSSICIPRLQSLYISTRTFSWAKVNQFSGKAYHYLHV